MTKQPYIPSYAATRARILNAVHYFHLLGVHKGSTAQDLQLARKRLAMQVHPDVNNAPDAHLLMARVNVAYTALTDCRFLYLATLGGRECTACRGNGYTIKQKGFNSTIHTTCTACLGSGRLR